MARDDRHCVRIDERETSAVKVQAAPSVPWRNRVVGTGEESPADLVANPSNWRIHTSPQQKAMAGALSEVGWVGKVLVNRTTGHLVDGHLRVQLARDRGEPTVPVSYVELSEAEERLVLASLDPIGALADADDAKLTALLAGLEATDPGLRALLADLGERHGLARAGSRTVSLGNVFGFDFSLPTITLPPSRAAAITIGAVTFLRDEAYMHDDALMGHEYIHVMQYAANSLQEVDYLAECGFVVGWSDCGNAKNPYEAIAYLWTAWMDNYQRYGGPTAYSPQWYWQTPKFDDVIKAAPWPF